MRSLLEAGIEMADVTEAREASTSQAVLADRGIVGYYVQKGMIYTEG
jgi:hypothetical protein